MKGKARSPQRAVRATRPTDKGALVDFATTGPGTLAGRYLRRFWQPVALSADLRPGHALPIRVMGQDLTLYRADGGAPHAVGFRCAHRGMLLSAGFVEGDAIRCSYHGWKYDGQGQCVEQPAEDQGFAAKVRIPGYPVQDYLGHVFVFLGEPPVPPLPRYPRFEAEGVQEASSYTRRCNYFQNVENNVDELHVPFTHRASGYTQHGLNFDLPRVEAEETSYGLAQHGYRAGEKVRSSHFLMPTMIYFRASPVFDFETDWRDILSYRVPIDDESHRSPVITLVHVRTADLERYREVRERLRSTLAALPSQDEVTDAVLAGRLRMQDIPDRPDIVLIQDHIAQIGQGAVADRRSERLGRSDSGIVLLRKLWSRELRSLAAGHSLTRWVVPPGLLATTGL
jgi:5,5'-dehydrodivanillate O-demethylase oxygenase subunit